MMTFFSIIGVLTIGVGGPLLALYIYWRMDETKMIARMVNLLARQIANEEARLGVSEQPEVRLMATKENMMYLKDRQWRLNLYRYKPPQGAYPKQYYLPVGYPPRKRKGLEGSISWESEYRRRGFFEELGGMPI